MGEYQLGAEIVSRSVANTWDEARLEWTIHEIYKLEPPEDPETCLCGNYPIMELCVLRNRQNGAKAIVGNVCVTKFMRLGSKQIFDALRRVASDEEKALNVDAIAHAHAKGWISDWDRKFYLDTWRKHKGLSPKQLAKRVQINRKVLTRIRRSP